MRDLVSQKMMARSQQSKQTNQKYGNIDCAIFLN